MFVLDMVMAVGICLSCISLLICYNFVQDSAPEIKPNRLEVALVFDCLESICYMDLMNENNCNIRLFSCNYNFYNTSLLVLLRSFKNFTLFMYGTKLESLLNIMLDIKSYYTKNCQTSSRLATFYKILYKIKNK